jgi:hypothetical protein
MCNEVEKLFANKYFNANDDANVDSKTTIDTIKKLGDAIVHTSPYVTTLQSVMGGQSLVYAYKNGFPKKP